MEPANAGDSNSRPSFNLWISATAQGSEPRLAALGHLDVHHPEWSPDGKCLAFLSKGNGSAKSNQVWLLRPDGQLPTCLTRTPKGVVDYRWSPVGAEIAFTTPERGDDEPDPIIGPDRFMKSWDCVIHGSRRGVIDDFHHNAAFRIMPTGVRRVMRHRANRAGPSRP